MKNWIIEGVSFKYLSVCSISVSIFEANMCVGGNHSSQHEDDMLCNFHHLTWGFLDRKLGEAIQCEGGLEQQDMPCRGGLSDEYPMNIRRFFRQTGVFWGVFFFGGNKRNTHQEWQMLAVSMQVSLVSVSYFSFWHFFKVWMSSWLKKTSAKSGDEFSRQMNDREADVKTWPVMHVTPGPFGLMHTVRNHWRCEIAML